MFGNKLFPCVKGKQILGQSLKSSTENRKSHRHGICYNLTQTRLLCNKWSPNKLKFNFLSVQFILKNNTTFNPILLWSNPLALQFSTISMKWKEHSIPTTIEFTTNGTSSEINPCYKFLAGSRMSVKHYSVWAQCRDQFDILPWRTSIHYSLKCTWRTTF